MSTRKPAKKPKGGPRGKAKQYCVSVSAAKYALMSRVADERGLSMTALLEQALAGEFAAPCSHRCADCIAERAGI